MSARSPMGDSVEVWTRRPRSAFVRFLLLVMIIEYAISDIAAPISQIRNKIIPLPKIHGTGQLRTNHTLIIAYKYIKIKFKAYVLVLCDLVGRPRLKA